jgi:CTP synthase
VSLAEGTKARALYGRERIRERHRHRFEFNNNYREQMEREASSSPACRPDSRLVELIELRDHPWFMACQYTRNFNRSRMPAPALQGFCAGLPGA